MTKTIDYTRLRIGGGGSTEIRFTVPGSESEFMFVDVEAVGAHTPRSIAAAIRRIASEIQMKSGVVVRAPRLIPESDSSADTRLRDEVTSRLRLTDGSTEVAVLSHPVGRNPTLIGGEFLSIAFGTEAISTLRNSEISALVQHRSALVQSTTAKFVLPSSKTADSFLRVADILATRRDCEAVALWLLAVLPPTPGVIALAIDTPGLLPLAMTLERYLESLDSSVTQIITADSYPYGRGDADALFRELSPCDCFVFLLSVSKSGRFERTVASALDSLGPSFQDRVLVTICDLRDDVPPLLVPGVRHHRVSQLLPPEPPSQADLDSRPTITVEAGSFRFSTDQEAITQPFPSPPEGLQSCFLEVAAEASAIGVECSPFASGSGSLRPRNQLLNFRVLLDRLSAAVPHFLEVNPSCVHDATAALREAGLQRSYDILILPDADGGIDKEGATRAVRALAMLGIEIGESMYVSDLGSAKRPAEASALLFLWGSVTGASVVRACRTVDEWLDTDQADCCVFHFRPPSTGEMTFLHRALGGRSLATLWWHVMPWASVFESEASRLSRWLAMDPEAERWSDQILRRIELIAPTGRLRDWEYRNRLPTAGSLPSRPPTDLLWVESSEASNEIEGESHNWLRHTPTLLFGALVAIEQTRSSRSSMDGPRIKLVDGPRLSLPARWVAGVVRCASPGELWFGLGGYEQSRDTEFLCDWMDNSPDGDSVLGELLAADALGKVPSEASSLIRSYAEDVAGTDSDEPLRMLLDYTQWARGDSR